MSENRTLETVLQEIRDSIVRYLPHYPHANTEEFQALVVSDPHAAKKLLAAEKWQIDNYNEVNARALAVLGRTVTEVGHDIIRDRLAKMKEREEMILALDLSAPRCDLGDFIITETRGKQTTTKLDFGPVTDVLEKAYGFTFRGVYSDLRYGSNRAEVAQFGFSEDEIDEGYRSSPKDGPLAAKVFSVLGFYTDDLVPHLDHWHHLLDHDFSELRRGGTNYMSLPSEDEDYKVEEHPIFAKIREIYALECAVAGDGDCLLFEVDW